MILLKQIASIVLGGGVVSLLNLAVYAAGLGELGAEKFSQIIIVVALFFGCIDVFNSGSSKILINQSFVNVRRKIIQVDMFLSIFSFLLFFVLSSFFSGLFGLNSDFSLSQLLVLFLMFFVYMSTQFHLGFLRFSGRNHLVSILLIIIPLSRLVLVFFLSESISGENFICLWLLVEVAPSLMFYIISKNKLKLCDSDDVSCRSFYSLYSPMFQANWLSNFIYSFSKHFDVVLFAFLFSPTLSSYYKVAKSVYNMAFNIGGSLVVYLFNHFPRGDLQGWFSLRNSVTMLASYTLLFVFNIYSASLIDISDGILNAHFPSALELFFITSTTVLIFFPAIFSRLIHYGIQAKKPSMFIQTAIADVVLLAITMVTIACVQSDANILASVYVTPIFSFVSLSFFYFVSKGMKK